MKQEYQTQIYYSFNAFAAWLLIIIVPLAIFVCLAVAIKSPIFGVIGLILVFIMPFFFQSNIKRRFTKSAFLEFDENVFSIQISDLDNKTIERTTSYRWSEIKAYKFYFTPSKLTYLDIYLRDGKCSEFGFKDNKTQGESIRADDLNIFNVFRSFIKKYNSNKMDDEKIILRPGFLTTRKGTFIMFLLGALILTGLLILIFANPSSSPFLFIGIFIFIPLLVKRKSDKNLYDQMSDLQ